jgi:hypothetical protein
MFNAVERVQTAIFIIAVIVRCAVMLLSFITQQERVVRFHNRFDSMQDFRHHLYLRFWFLKYYLIHNLGARLCAKLRDRIGLRRRIANSEFRW